MDNVDQAAFVVPLGTQPRIQDPQWFALSWYGQSVQRICMSRGVEPMGPGALDGSPFAGLSGLASGHLIATSSGLARQALDTAGTVVMGGPCIGDCGTYPTLEALYDSVQVLETARRLDVPALLFVGDQEEMIESGGARRWIRIGERMEHWLRGVADVLDGVRLTVVRTSGMAHRVALEPALERVRALRAEALDSCFHLAEVPPRVQSEVARDVTRRVIAAHLPGLVGRHVPDAGATPLVLVAENLQQVGVWCRAAEAHIGCAGGLAFAGHWPAPSLSGAERMFRAQSSDKAPAWILEDLALGRVAGVHPYSVDFYERWLTPSLRHDLSARAKEAWQRS